MIKKLDTLFTNDAIIFVNKGSNNLTFFGGEMVTLSKNNLGKNNLDDVTFDEDDCQRITHVQLMVWNRYKQYRFNRYKQRK